MEPWMEEAQAKDLEEQHQQAMDLYAAWAPRMSPKEREVMGRLCGIEEKTRREKWEEMQEPLRLEMACVGD